MGQVRAPAPRRIEFFGFNDNSIAEGRVSARTDADLLSKVGANAIRVTLSWAGVEPTPGHFDFAFADSLYRAMREKGISVLWIPMFAPTWASAPGCPPVPAVCHAPPAPQHDGDWTQFLVQLVRRYPQSAGIEVWNEPNYQFFWMPAPDPARYAQLLAESYRAIKQVDPKMPVVSGGIGNKPVTQGPDMSLDAFTKAMFDHGAGANLDAIGVHPYPLGPDESQFESSLQDIRAIRAAHGYPHKPLWLTETGWTTTGTNFPLSPADQALELTDLVRRAESMDDVQALFFHTLLEAQGPSQDFETGFGVLHANGQPKPAGVALEREFARLRSLVR